MKPCYLVVIFFACLFVACKKSSTNPVNPPPSGGNGGNGNDTLSVTGFSPLNPYTTDELTITGTGFSPDKTKDTVIVGFGVAAGGKPATINSATATQLKIMLPPDSVLLPATSNFPVYAFEIHVNGKRLQLGLDKAPIIKPTLHFGGFIRNTPPWDVFRPGDSIAVTGQGYITSGSGCSIDGNAVILSNLDTTTSGLLSWTNPARYNVLTRWAAHSAIPRTIFGEVNDETIINTKTVTFTNGDGKSGQALLKFGLSPIMLITNLYFETTFDTQNGYSYSLSDLNSKGGKIRLHIIGKYLKSSTDLEFYGRDFSNATVNDVHSSLPVSGFPDSTVVEYGTSGLVAGYNYWVNITSNSPGKNTAYGFIKFYVKP